MVQAPHERKGTRGIPAGRNALPMVGPLKVGFQGSLLRLDAVQARQDIALWHICPINPHFHFES